MIKIIGRGLIGQSLSRQFSAYCSGHDHQSARFECDLLIVAAPSGNRLTVEQNPGFDLDNCKTIADTIARSQFRCLIHISTVDIYPDFCSETSAPESQPCDRHYGHNRWWLEHTLHQQFGALVIRLPSICDRQITKNLLYDLHHQSWLSKINPESRLQWYPLSRLRSDIEHVISHNRSHTNLSSVPIPNHDIVKHFRPDLVSVLGHNLPTVLYDVKNDHGAYWINHKEIWQHFADYFS